ncbi:MAG: YceI family protein [Bacteroidetes bacterium]|nr:YceI family protein [Bacteroidota bacterium]MBU1372554.1 YceI family protein [Bacteroidota bacterium]MBU1485037.1 YceI family protein [Bacteroidota bacterium]MBU1761519.1 YceI family protein [Bacteroidota bacterium]MBU2269324.1 YceI family protein [Bacteroidota bacterium]
MRYLSFLLFFLLSFNSVTAQVYEASEMYIHFFSPAPIADIEAVSNAATAKLNEEKKEVEIMINISSFKFKKALMQTHFNEKYIESSRYPKASFKGKYKETLDLDKDGVYVLNLEGHFNIHGVERAKTVPCTITVKSGKIIFETKFKILSEDYKIKAPDIIYRKVGQEVTIDANGILLKN